MIQIYFKNFYLQNQEVFKADVFFVKEARPDLSGNNLADKYRFIRKSIAFPDFCVRLLSETGGWEILNRLIKIWRYLLWQILLLTVNRSRLKTL